MRFWLVFALLVLAATVAAVVYAARNPTDVFGTSERAVATSLKNELQRSGADVGAAECSDRGDGAWSCGVEAAGGSGVRGYELKVDDEGCWRSRRGGGQSGPRGCIDLLDVAGVDFL